MLTHEALIERLGGPHKLAAALTALGVPTLEVTARAWAMRGNIPARYWQHVREVADASGAPISLDELADPIAAARAA